MFDVVIANGLAVLPTGPERVDIGVKGGKIVAIAAPKTLGAIGAERVVDATDQIVIPGGIDPHIHCGLTMPGPNGTSVTGATPAEVSKAALFGGTTTMCDFAFWQGSGTLQQTVEKRHESWTDACYSDYTLHMAVESPMGPSIIGEVPELVQAGYPTVKMFTTDITPGRLAHLTNHGEIWEMLKQLAKSGGLALIHAEDNDLVMHMYEKLIAEDRVGFEHLAEAHTVLSEELAFNRVIALAQNVEGAAMYMVHTSARTGVDAIAASRAKGFPIYGETLHQYALFNVEDYKRPNGQIYHTYPSLKYPDDQAALWRGMKDGVLSCVATDEVCCPLEVKLVGKRIDDTTGGNSGCEPRVALMYTEMVGKRGFSLNEFVDLVSTKAARIMGLYPRKGVLAVGSDADVVLLDPNLAHTIDGSALHSADYSPWDGWDVSVWPSLTMLRGKVVVEGGQFNGELTDGAFIPRKIADDIRSGPAV
ncbi:amidohydrolase family protein [Kaistia dalseonensis]|uniref:Dihydropyrimidinase n=1 Tax=Kaistia dalseonensis TaxID=410840 RepID=A0ABU0H426_9HYPH|nr:amidohydrolase family protein [Kaistia dalseonensis]MCX5494484.1 amidohydrolase family protein [Kaistia dalseonensis]MDQ0437063.1 dihydropyrimidinase [Kaistia dalseonensis]